MNLREKRRILRSVFHVLGADKIIGVYCIFFIIVSFLLWIIEPSITSFQDSIWYCFITVTTTGYGDIVATTLIGRILVIILSIYSIGVIAVFTAVLTSYFMENAKSRVHEIYREFLDDLEHLDELSKDELKDLSNRVKSFNKK